MLFLRRHPEATDGALRPQSGGVLATLLCVAVSPRTRHRKSIWTEGTTPTVDRVFLCRCSAHTRGRGSRLSWHLPLTLLEDGQGDPPPSLGQGLPHKKRK